jgi:hypothetical protein
MGVTSSRVRRAHGSGCGGHAASPSIALGALPLRVAFALVLVLGACGGAPPQPATARLRVLVHPEDARVYVDERFAGSARLLSRRPLVLRPGPRTVTVTAPGHFPHDLALDLPPGLTTLRVTLRPVPPK